MQDEAQKNVAELRRMDSMIGGGWNRVGGLLVIAAAVGSRGTSRAMREVVRVLAGEQCGESVELVMLEAWLGRG